MPELTLTPAQWRVLEAMGEGAVLFIEINWRNGVGYRAPYLVWPGKRPNEKTTMKDIRVLQKAKLVREHALTPAGREALEKRKENHGRSTI